jgi:hypothetical protein
VSQAIAARGRPGRASLSCRYGLICWIFYLGSTLPNAGPTQDWSTASLTRLGTWQLTWVGLDVLEVAGLASTGYLLRRSHPQTRTAALLAAPLFVVDGWFDVLTASSRSDMALSVAMLGLAELPVAIFLLLIARRAREYETRSDHPASPLDATRGPQDDRAAAEDLSASIQPLAYGPPWRRSLSITLRRTNKDYARWIRDAALTEIR